MLHKSFKPAKCKTALNLAKSRIKLMKNKKDIQLKQMRRELAQLLESGQDQTARIRVEHVVREEKAMAAYEIIELYCELVVARLPIIESQKNCPLDLKEAIASLIFAAPRCGDITELQDVRKHFTAKYGKDFASAAVELRPNCGVSRTLIEKLSVNSPDGPTKVKILTAIAEEHNVKWEPNWFKEDPEPIIDIPKLAVAQSVGRNSIQMQPLNFEIADGLEEKHAHDTGRPGTSSQSHIHSSNDLIPSSSPSRPDTRRSEFSSENTVSSQSSGTAETAFNNGRQNWNMEFKDARAAAQAAAESAELASIAARAAAELSSRTNVMSESSSEPRLPSVHILSENNHHSAVSGPQRSHVHTNSTTGSFNHRIPRMQNQGEANREGDMSEGGEATSSNMDYTQFREQYEAGKQDFTDMKSSIRYERDSDSSPIVSKAEPSTFRSSNFQDSEIESSENPFYEETLEQKNQLGSLQSQSSTFGDEYGDFSNLNYDRYMNDSGDGSFGRFSRKTADEEDWHVHSAYTYGEEDVTFKSHSKGNRVLESDEKDGFDSGRDLFVGMEHRTSGMGNAEKDIRRNDVVFDESGSDDDDDDEGILNPAEEHNFPSASNFTHKDSSLSEDNLPFEPDLSKSFRSSSLYSKLIEPMPLVFDDSDGASSGSESENEQQREKSDPGVLSYDYRKRDADRNFEHMRSSHFETSEHEENQSTYPDSVSKHKSGFDDPSQSYYNQTSSVVVSSDLRSRSDYGLFDKGEPQKSLHSLRLSESQLPVSELGNETQLRPGSGMELDLGSLPGGRRNRAHWRIPRGGLGDASSPSRSMAPPSDTFGSSEKASSLESSSQIDNKQVPKKSGLYTQYDLPGDDTEVAGTPKDSKNAKGPYRGKIHEDVHKTSPKDCTGYFDSDASDPEEDVPKPVVNKTFVGAGLSRRTKTSAPRSVASCRTSDVAAKKMGQSSRSHATEVSSSRIIDQSSSDDEGTIFGQSVDTKASRDDRSSYSSISEKPMTPKSPDVVEATSSNEKAPSRENSAKLPSHVHPKLPDFETFTALLQSLRKNRQ